MEHGSRRQVLCVGQATLDHVFEVPFVMVGHKNVASSYRAVGGGVAANAAVAVSRLGGRATLLGCVGADPVGDQVVRDLIDEGVDVSLVARRAHATTPTSCVIVDASGERTIVNHTPADLFSDVVPDLGSRRPDAVLVDGRWRCGTERALRLARKLGVPGIVDVDRAPSDNQLAHFRFAEIELASHLVLSSDALAALTGTSDPADGLARVAESTAAVVAVTLGAEGVGWLDDGHYGSLPAFDVAVVDSTGAGDVFHGAFALGLAERMELPDALRFASAAAALKCARLGGRLGTPDRRAVDDFLTIGALS